jgi:hypothetical protein
MKEIEKWKLVYREYFILWRILTLVVKKKSFERNEWKVTFLRKLALEAITYHWISSRFVTCIHQKTESVMTIEWNSHVFYSFVFLICESVVVNKNRHVLSHEVKYRDRWWSNKWKSQIQFPFLLPNNKELQ